jgi:hypothetical protein
MKHQFYRDLLTLTESSFDLSTGYESIWLPFGDAAPERERKMLPWPNMMRTIVWNRHGSHVIDALPNGYKFKSHDSISHILGAVSQIPPQYKSDPN